MAYATATDFTDRYDANDLGDLAADDGTQVASASLAINRKIIAALDDASGEIDAALLVGGRYEPSQLRDLIGHSRAHLVRLTCDIAMARLLMRRPGRDIEKSKAIQELAEKSLERLRHGENAFNLSDQVEAQLETTQGLTAVEYSQSGLIRDRVRNYYPARNLGTI